VTSLDHSVVAVSDWERSNAFYRDVLGAELIERGARWAYRFGDQQLNVHGPGASGDPATSVPVRPGDSHMCVRWDGAIEEAIEHLARHGLLVDRQETSARVVAKPRRKMTLRAVRIGLRWPPTRTARYVRFRTQPLASSPLTLLNVAPWSNDSTSNASGGTRPISSRSRADFTAVKSRPPNLC
jgi:catechol 2,3-dioxygenase-like lactoylglutathione lyase family enzyme